MAPTESFSEHCDVSSATRQRIALLQRIAQLPVELGDMILDELAISGLGGRVVIRGSPAKSISCSVSRVSPRPRAVLTVLAEHILNGWTHNEFPTDEWTGDIFPDEFIPLALAIMAGNDCGLIYRVEKAIVRSVDIVSMSPISSPTPDNPNPLLCPPSLRHWARFLRSLHLFVSLRFRAVPDYPHRLYMAQRQLRDFPAQLVGLKTMTITVIEEPDLSFNGRPVRYGQESRGDYIAALDKGGGRTELRIEMATMAQAMLALQDKVPYLALCFHGSSLIREVDYAGERRYELNWRDPREPARGNRTVRRDCEGSSASHAENAVNEVLEHQGYNCWM